MPNRIALPRPLFIIAAMLILAAGINPALAQAPLTQTTQLTGEDYMLTISYPANWTSEAMGGRLCVATSTQSLWDMALYEGVEIPDDVGLEILPPSFAAEFNLRPPIKPSEFISIVAAYGQIDTVSAIKTLSDFPVPGAMAVVTFLTDPGKEAVFGVLAFPAGLVSFLASTSHNTFDATTLAILQSIRLTKGMLEATAQATVSGSPVTLTVQQKNGTYQFSAMLPDGWAYDNEDQSDETLFFASSQLVLDAVEHSSELPGLGEILITVDLPNTLADQGLPLTEAPADALQLIENQPNTYGKTQPESSFVVPTASADLTGDVFNGYNLTDYALGFAGGTIIADVPTFAVNDTTLGILRSIRFTEVSTANATSEASSTEQSTQSP